MAQKILQTAKMGNEKEENKTISRGIPYAISIFYRSLSRFNLGIAMKHICKGCMYCIINRTEMRQTGNGYEVRCPICSWLYDPEEEKRKEEESIKQDIVNRILGNY